MSRRATICEHGFYVSRCKACRSEYQKQYYRQIKLAVLDHYSLLKGMSNPDGMPIKAPCCGTCQESDLSELTIDHIEGDGKAHRKSLGGGGNGFYLWLKRQGYPFGYQTLCKTHNMKKEIWDGEYEKRVTHRLAS